MNIRYPVRKADGRDYKNYDELLTDIRKNAHGGGYWALVVTGTGGSTSGRHRLRPRCWIRKRRKNPCRSSS